ncbi:MAG: Na+/H+ antiporter subunit E, partial [Lysobacter sp.]|nr:Na+/H+ antiporter subunit E [Lysobacter sp.]
MKRILPSPPLSAAVFLLWLLLVAEVSAGQVLLGAMLAVALPLLAGMLQPQRARFGRTAMILVLIRRVLWDIVLANIEV